MCANSEIAHVEIYLHQHEENSQAILHASRKAVAELFRSRCTSIAVLICEICEIQANVNLG